MSSGPMPSIHLLCHKQGSNSNMLGTASFFHRFIPQFSARAALLTDLTGSRCRSPVQWTEEAVAAFHYIQQLSKKPVLYSPNFDEDVILQTDASYWGLGAVLLQGPPSSCLHQLETVPQGGSVFDSGKDSFRYYLLGREFPLGDRLQSASVNGKDEGYQWKDHPVVPGTATVPLQHSAQPHS